MRHNVDLLYGSAWILVDLAISHIITHRQVVFSPFGMSWNSLNLDLLESLNYYNSYFGRGRTYNLVAICGTARCFGYFEMVATFKKSHTHRCMHRRKKKTFLTISWVQSGILVITIHKNKRFLVDIAIVKWEECPVSSFLVNCETRTDELNISIFLNPLLKIKKLV